MEARRVHAGNGWHWIKDGISLYKKSVAEWTSLFFVLVLLGMIYVGVSFALVKQDVAVLRFIVFALEVTTQVLMPVIVAGIMAGAMAVDQNRELEIATLFSGFSKNTTGLITLGGIAMVAGLIAVAVATAVVGLDRSDLQDVRPEVEIYQLIKLVVLLFGLMTPLIMGYWFAPALVYFNGVKPISAIKLSFNACVLNLKAFIVYSLSGAVLLLVFGLVVGVIVGLLGSILFAVTNNSHVVQLISTIAALAIQLIIAPVIFTSIYASFKDIFDIQLTADDETTVEI